MSNFFTNKKIKEGNNYADSNLPKNIKSNVNSFAYNPIMSPPNIKTNINPKQMNYDSFLMKNEIKKNVKNVPQTIQNNRINSSVLQNNLLIPFSEDSQPKTSTGIDFIQGLEAKVENMNQKLNKLQDRVDKDEKITISTKEDITDLKTSLNQNFSKLDNILEKLATKLN